MHAIVLVHLQSFIGKRLTVEEGVWEVLFQRAGLEPIIFTPLTTCDPLTAARIFTAAAEMRGEDVPTFLRGYGRYLFPEIMKQYGGHFRMSGGEVFEILEQLDAFYRRLRNGSNMDPPRIQFDRESRRYGVLHLRSNLDDVFPQICNLAHGMLEGLSDYVGQRMAIRQIACVGKGDVYCSFQLRPRIESSSALPTVQKILGELGNDSEDDG